MLVHRENILLLRNPPAATSHLPDPSLLAPPRNRRCAAQVLPPTNPVAEHLATSVCLAPAPKLSGCCRAACAAMELTQMNSNPQLAKYAQMAHSKIELEERASTIV